MRIERYTSDHKNTWDDFVRMSKNGTFMLERDFIEYHGDRFEDHSLLFYDDKDNLIALLPGHISEQAYSSHSGLTYAGFVSGARIKQPLMMEVLETLQGYLKEKGLTELWYKSISHFYHRQPAQEDVYALWMAGAERHRVDVFPVIDLRDPFPFQERRRRGVKKARKNGIEVRESDDLETYWDVLCEVLKKHDAAPIHSLAEITYLKEKFPENIKLYAAFQEEKMVAGVLIFETDIVAKSQYIATLDAVMNLGALDLLFDEVIFSVYKEKRFFDFGSVTIDQGRTLVVGLSEQKEGFGARTAVQEHYRLSLT